MNDDEVIKQRISGRSARAIAKAQATTVAEVTLDRFTETTIDDKVRRHPLALELARLDELQETLLRPSPGRPRVVRCSNHEKSSNAAARYPAPGVDRVVRSIQPSDRSRAGQARHPDAARW